MATKTTDQTRRRRATPPKRPAKPAITATAPSCPPWCVDCEVGQLSHDLGDRYHHSAAAHVPLKATAGAGGIRHDETLSLIVERYDAVDDPERQQTNVTVYIDDASDVIGEISPAVARQFAHAVATQARWVQRWIDGVDEPITVSTVPNGHRALQVSVAVESDTAVVFVNYATVGAAAIRSNVRFAAENESNPYLAWHAVTPETFDLTLSAAEKLAANLYAYAAIADGQAPTCPVWCSNHMTDPDGSVAHEGAAVEVKVAGDETLIGGVVTLKLTRFDEPGRVGTVAVCLQSSQDGIDLSPAELRTVAAIAEQLAAVTEVTR